MMNPTKWIRIPPYYSTSCLRPFLFCLAGFKGNLSLITGNLFFCSKGLGQMEALLNQGCSIRGIPCICRTRRARNPSQGQVSIYGRNMAKGKERQERGLVSVFKFDQVNVSYFDGTPCVVVLKEHKKGTRPFWGRPKKTYTSSYQVYKPESLGLLMIAGLDLGLSLWFLGGIGG